MHVLRNLSADMDSTRRYPKSECGFICVLKSCVNKSKSKLKALRVFARGFTGKTEAELIIQ